MPYKDEDERRKHLAEKRTSDPEWHAQRKQSQREWYAKNREEQREKMRGRYQAMTPEERAAHNAKSRENYDPAKQKAAYLRWYYKPENHEKLIASNAKSRLKRSRDSELDYVKDAGRVRPDCCEMCGRQDGGRSKTLNTVWDHDHKTGQFRGWLCSHCNTAIGKQNDDAAMLLGSALYVHVGGTGSGPVPRNLKIENASEILDWLAEKVLTQWLISPRKSPPTSEPLPPSRAEIKGIPARISPPSISLPALAPL